MFGLSLSMMEAAFVRAQGKRDRIYVRRTDGSEVSWSFPTYGDELPHDLVHLVVESAFDILDGFWGRVDAGVDPERVNAEANRLGGAEKYKRFGREQEHLFLAEALTGVPWGWGDVSDPDALEAVQKAYRELDLELPAAASLERVRDVIDILFRLRAQWRQLLPKGALHVTFTTSSPQEGFKELATGAR